MRISDYLEAKLKWLNSEHGGIKNVSETDYAKRISKTIDKVNSDTKKLSVTIDDVEFDSNKVTLIENPFPKNHRTIHQCKGSIAEPRVWRTICDTLHIEVIL